MMYVPSSLPEPVRIPIWGRRVNFIVTGVMLTFARLPTAGVGKFFLLSFLEALPRSGSMPVSGFGAR